MSCARLRFHAHIEGDNQGSKVSFRGPSEAFVTYCNIFLCLFRIIAYSMELVYRISSVIRQSFFPSKTIPKI